MKVHLFKALLKKGPGYKLRAFIRDGWPNSKIWLGADVPGIPECGAPKR